MVVEPISRSVSVDGVLKSVVFARHETFHPRFGWLKKGFDRAAADAEVFLHDESPIRLGVGKNMVRAIRYWCSAFKLLADDHPTEFGQQLLGPGGWDPYLEDPASLWLLHWKLLERQNLATAWDFIFNSFRHVDFTVEDLFYQLCEYRDREAPRISDSSLKKDISCALRMYVGQSDKSQGKAQFSEDSLDCPFTELGLIHTAGDSRHYMFRLGPKPTLSPEIIVYACLCHQSQTAARTASIASLLYDIGSPGLVFKLTESALCDAIEIIARRWQPITLSDAAGKLQFSFEGEPQQLAADILDRYYRLGR